MSVRANPALIVADDTGLSECLDRLAAQKRYNRPVSTYRLQFHHGFRFRDACRLVPYLYALGITHCYASPILRARAGSTHGYDITDHNEINPEIGSEEDFHDLVRELKEHGMGLVLDTVPNHMGVGNGDNPWWQDLLENGRASQYAEFFDIDWEPVKAELHSRVLIPILSASYGEELEQGRIQLHYGEGQFYVTYYDKKLPVDPQTVPMIFETLGDLRAQPAAIAPGPEDRSELENVLWNLRQLPPHTTMEADLVQQRQREIPELKRRFRELLERSSQADALVAEAVRRCNGEPGNPRSFDALHRLLEAQAYRLSYWRVSAQEINYRRFFDINDLVGLRMDNPRVFAATHKLIRRLLAEGSISGLRVDHPDGLLNPVQYFTRVQMLYAASQCIGPEPRGVLAENGIELGIQEIFGQHDWMNQQAPLYVLVEKILEPGEPLPQNWPVDGTVGYEFVRLVNGIFIDQRNARPFATLYRRFIGGSIDIDTVVYESKKLIMHTALASEVTVLSHMLEEICSTDRHARDFTRLTLTDAIRETIACFPVYRTYIDERGNIGEHDREVIHLAIARAKRRNPSMAASLFDWLGKILLLQARDFVGPEGHRLRLDFVLKFQQLTGPVMAKGLEDTACYVYNRFIGVNEVGSTPAEFGISVDEFHRSNLERNEKWPFAMLATSTHDSKRSEDVRARLNVISELPREWASQVMRWRRLNRGYKRIISDGRSVPDFNEEYFLYQTLVGAWPLSMSSQQENESFRGRIQQYMTKAVHEAKVNLSWVNQNPEYVAALEYFIERILAPDRGRKANLFRQEIERFLPPVMFFGAMNSLAQTLIKLTAPGMPDVYQGNEIWDFSLVDPDNRRPVDFELRMRMLDELHPNPPEPGMAGTSAAVDVLAGQAIAALQPAALGITEERDGSAGAIASSAAVGSAAATPPQPMETAPLIAQLLEHWRDGRLKLWTTQRALRFRREHPELFQSGSYMPLYGAVEKQEHLVAFARVHEGAVTVTAVPRLAYSLMKGRLAAPIAEAWGAAELALPLGYAEFENVLTGERLASNNGRTLLCRELFAHFPVALLAAR